MADKKYTVLYVDDEQINLELFKALFIMHYNVLLAESPIEALDLLKKTKVDLIVTDQKMPEMTGVEFLKEVFKIFPNEPPYRILTSGYTEIESVSDAFDNYKLLKSIPKPWNIALLKSVIAEVLEKGKVEM